MRARVVVSLDGAIVTEIELTKDVTVVGRHPSCDICIDNPAISGRHMLFRIVDKTAYAEDLASTNGTKVNGHSTQHQVVHHLDLIEVGHHKLHFFDDELLADGGISNLETTVHTDFEKTMMAAHAAPSPATDAGPGEGGPLAHHGDPERHDSHRRSAGIRGHGNACGHARLAPWRFGPLRE
jgi:pSer/pThr/pTyr-binding forkhead associated (FHA) protein